MVLNTAILTLKNASDLTTNRHQDPMAVSIVAAVYLWWRGGKIAEFARVAINLQELRQFADYDPSHHFTPDEAKVAISEAQEAIKWFREGTTEQQETFLTLLLFKAR